MTVIDVHAHVLPPSYLALLEKNGFDARRDEGFPTPAWSPEAHLEFADEAGINYSVVTLSTPHMHFGNDAEACAAARAINEEFAQFCNGSPQRFGFCAALPLPCVEESIEEARYAFDELGALGVKVPSSAQGVYLGDERFNDLFAFLDERAATIIIHPSTPSQFPQNCFTSVPKPLFEFLADTTRTVLNMIAHGTLEKYPHVNVVVPHCGSFLSEVLHRTIGISKVLVPAGIMEPCDVEAGFARLYYDIAGNARPVMLDALLKVADPSHVMFGGDWPYTPAPMVSAALADYWTCPELEGIRDKVMFENAAALFGLKPLETGCARL